MTVQRSMISPNFTYIEQPENVEAAEETKQGEEKEIKEEVCEAERELRSLPALKNQAQRLAMKLDLNKRKQPLMLREIDKRRQALEQRKEESEAHEQLNRRSPPKYRRDPISVGGYAVKPIHKKDEIARDAKMIDKIFYM